MPATTIPNPFGSRSVVATDPDNLEPGQVLYTGFDWVRIIDLTPDRYGQVKTQRAGKPFTDRMYLSRVRECVRSNHSPT